MVPNAEQMAILLETCPNIPVILVEMLEGTPVETIRGIVPFPDEFDEDVSIMIGVGLLSCSQLDGDETPTISNPTESVWNRE